MNSYYRDNYRETEILTAPPQRLRLMLIQGAIRSIEQAREQWHAGENEQGFEKLLHAQEIVTELLNGIDPEAKDEITQKVAAIYLFIFRRLVEANLLYEEQKLDDAVRVLREEEATWQQVCEQLGDSGRHSAVDVSLKEPAGTPAPTGSAPIADVDMPGESAAGFSLEA